MRTLIFVSALLIQGLGNQQSVFAQDASVQSETLVTTQPVSRMQDQWWKDRHAAKIKAASDMEKVDVVLLGDSITHSWETTGKDVWNSEFGSMATLNLGFSGDRTEHVLWRLDNGELDGIDPAVVMIMIGTNNTGHRLDKPADIAEGVKAIVDSLKTKLPNAKLLLLGVFPYDKDPESARRKNNNAVNAIICDLHDGQSVHYLDICDRFFNESGDMTKEITPDFLHLSPDGYQIWADSIKEKLAELIDGE